MYAFKRVKNKKLCKFFKILVNKKGLGIRVQFSKNIAYDYIYYLAEFHSKMLYDSQDIFKNVLYFKS